MLLLKDVSGDEVVEENFHIDAAYGSLSELSSAYGYPYGYSYKMSYNPKVSYPNTTLEQPNSMT